MSFFERAPVENSKSYILRYFSTERNILNILIPRVFPQGFNIISTEFSTDLGKPVENRIYLVEISFLPLL